VVLLFRLVDPCEGLIKVGGRNVTAVGLQKLRQQMAVVPQSALIMDGTIR
jgi:ABC-type multidrug transport system fused ATPase/permease subunit